MKTLITLCAALLSGCAGVYPPGTLAPGVPTYQYVAPAPAPYVPAQMPCLQGASICGNGYVPAPAGGPSGFLTGSQPIGPDAYLCRYAVTGRVVIISHSGPCPVSL